MTGKLVIILVVVITSCTVYGTHNRHPNGNQYRRSGVHRDIQRDDPRPSRNGEHHLVAEEEEDRFVPAFFSIDYDASHGNNAVFQGHAIEMLAPQEVPEYDWREGGSRGLSELDRGGQEPSSSSSAVDGSQELLSRGSTDGQTQIQECGDRQIDPRHSVCCDGLVYRRTSEQDGARCCGRVAYDDRHFTCCQGRAIVRRGARLPLCCGDGEAAAALPDQCRPGYQNDTTGLGSTCCRSSGTGAWKCCIRGQGCCAAEGSAAIDVPGFRPACCHLANEELTSQCCAATYEKIRVLPDCCGGERLRPVCCRRRHSTDVRCCPATVGYCCGIGEGAVRTTAYPPRVILETRHTIHPQPVTYHPPRPVHTERLDRHPVFTYPPRPIHTTRLPYIHPTERTPLPRPTQPLYPRYTPRGPVGYSTVRYSPGLVVGGSPVCCQGRTQQRSCCLRTRSPTCCSSSLPRCCINIYFNVTCCSSLMQQQQQQQRQQQRVAQHPQVHGGVDREAEVRALSESELRQTNGQRPNQAQLPSNGHASNHNQRQRYGVTLSCCRLEPRDAATCCRNGYQESGRLPLCCISSPGDLSTAEDMFEAQNDAAGTSSHQHRNVSAHQRQRHQELVACNGVAFNAEQFLCCDNVLRRRHGFRPACCNSSAYDSYLYKCCDGTIRTSCGSGSRPKRRHA